MKPYFDHEKLNVYQLSLTFNEWVGEFLASVTAKAAAKDQLDRAATSIPLNIAEGNGTFSPKNRACFSDIARGSAVEAAASLDVLVSRKLATENVCGTSERATGGSCECADGVTEKAGIHVRAWNHDGA
jgi:four helix bundle protein